jgi:hypothetical protein
MKNVFVVSVFHFESLKVLYEVHKHFEISLPCSQEPVTWLYHKPGISTLLPPIIFL